ncbi:MAG: hypothetical protein JNK46_07465 [Methylobacteriaceae bacterium]|nr:hypothetical protein [Methylobacteriaceae bacterium]
MIPRIAILSTCLAAAMCGASALAAGPEAARGYWAVSEAPDGVKVGLIFPDFSPNTFAGLSFLCIPGTATVSGAADVAQRLPAGRAVEVTIRPDDSPAAYRARADVSQMDDSVRAVFETTLADPLLADLANAARLTIAVGKGRPRALPTRGAAGAVADFLSKCRK